MQLVKTLKAVSAVVALVVLGGIAQAQNTNWKIDPYHSEIGFSVKHMGLSTVHGRLGAVNGTVVLNDKEPAKDVVKATVDVNGIDTGNSQRDGHLKSADFFDAAKYPTATFISKKVVKKAGKLQLIGDLTLKATTKSVTLDLDGPSKDVAGPDGKTHRGFSGTTTINRQDFGLTWAKTLPTGEAMVGNDVKLTIDVELVKE